MNKICIFYFLLFIGHLNAQYLGSGVFTRIQSVMDLTDGYYIITSGTTKAMNNSHGGLYFSSTDIALVDNKIINPPSSMVWKIESIGTHKTIYNENSSKFISYDGFLGSLANSVQVADFATSDNQRWTITDNGNIFFIRPVVDNSRILSHNPEQNRWACYPGTQINPSLYKLEVPTPNETLNQTSGEINYTEAFPVSGNVLVEGVTNSAGQGAGIVAAIGMSFTNTNPNTWSNSYSWKSLAYTSDLASADVYGGNIGPRYQDGMGSDVSFWSPGVYYYATRFIAGTNTTYGGVTVGNVGGTWNGTTFGNGKLKIRTQVRPSQAGLTYNALTTPINAITAVGANLYTFEFRDDMDGSLVGEYTNALPVINFSALGEVATNRTYRIRVKANLAGGEMIDYGASINITLNNIVGLPRLRPSQCGLILAANNASVVLNALPVSGATLYEFGVIVNDGVEQVVSTISPSFNFGQLSPIPGRSSIISVRVRALSSGIWTPFGSTCNVFTVTQITRIRASQCGITVPNNSSTVINANAVADATSYYFEVTVNGGIPQIVNTFGPSFVFGQLTTLPGSAATINLRVCADVNTVRGEWSAICTVFTPSPADEEFKENISSNQEIVSYPNPFTNRFTLKLGNSSEASIQIFDINGRLLFNQIVNDSYEVELGQNLASGSYVLRINQNDKKQSMLIIKR